MRSYDCLVNVGASEEAGVGVTTVKKIGICAAEIMILRTLHGDQQVSDIRMGEMDRRGHTAERKMLDERYGKHVTDRLFGPSVGGRLPDELEGEFPGVNEGTPAPAAETEQEPETAETEDLTPKGRRKAA